MLRRLIAASLLILVAPVVASAGGVAHFDEFALRYYASEGQKDRVAAETQRLQRLDPNWQPPSDLYTARANGAGEDSLWALFAQDRLDELEQAIAARQAAEPTWRASDDLQTKLRAKVRRAQILGFAAKQDWRSIVKGLETTGIEWAAADAEALWLIAEAYAREKNCDQAYAVYRLALTNHREPAERRATIEHAIAYLPMALTEKLIAMGDKDSAGRSEFAAIATDITRARMSAFLHDEPAGDVSAEDLGTFETAVPALGDAKEAGLIAWYFYKRRDYPQALDWFKRAVAQGGDAMIAHGLALALQKLDRQREAEEVSYAWREPLVNNSILFIDLLASDLIKEPPQYVEPARMSRYAQVAIETESGEGAQALAWYAYNTCQFPLALKWFERAVAWHPKEATVFGYALTLQHLHRKEFRDVVNRYDGLFPKVVGLVFDDGVRQAPSPCDAKVRATASARRATPETTRTDWNGRTLADTLSPSTALRAAAPSRTVASLPSPDQWAANASTGMPVKKTEFPFAVTPENRLRFSSLNTSGTDQGVPDRTATAPLVARRVPGVGPMPYEQYGFTLLPGWDGTRQASSPAAERDAPQGTLWALEQSLRDPDTTSLPASGTESLSRRPMAKASLDPPAYPDR